MMLKDVLKRLPEDVQLLPEFKSLLVVLEKRRINSVEALKMLVDVEMAKCEEWLKKNNTGPTINRWRMHYGRRLKFYNAIKGKVLPFLK